MRLHGDRVTSDRLVYRKDGSESMFTGGDNEIWSYGEENTAILEKFIRLREAMRPYIRSLMAEAHKHGRPVMRTMFYEFPHDKESWELQDQYMFGSKLLVAPIIYENNYEREVYLPEGDVWILVNDQKEYEGGKKITVQAPIDQIPVFTRDKELLYMFVDAL